MRARLGKVDPALEECRKTIALLREITDGATDAHQRFKRAEAYEYLGALGGNEERAKEIAGKIAQCDMALGK